MPAHERPPSERSPPNAENHPAGATGLGESNSRGTVLLVDDDPLVLKSLARQLFGLGYTVHTAADGEEAMRQVRCRDHDAVLSDISMPNLDGLQLLRQVRTHDLDLPVVLVTGEPSVDTAIKAVEYGALQYLTKPVSELQLQAAVTRAIQTGRMLRVNREAASLVGARDPLASDRAGLEASFEHALQSMWMAYHPIVSAQTREVFGYEALLRNAGGSLANPETFVAAAEQLGRADELGRAVRAQAAAPFNGSTGTTLLFVNLRPEDLLDPKLLDPSAPLSKLADSVVLEITERSSLSNIADMRNRVGALREMGYRIAVDDLGAGYAGLTSFAQLEPEFVKLDMSLIRGVHESPVKQKVIGSITRLSLEMGLRVVAEGIETPAERDTVVALGCDLLQGFHFARPDRPFPTVRW